MLREPEYYAKQATVLSDLINVLGYTVATFMAVGATFGALNCMYSAIASRQVEIATLRAIGFGGAPVVISVMIEALVLSLLGRGGGRRPGLRLLRRRLALHAQLQHVLAGRLRLPRDAGPAPPRAHLGAGHRPRRRAPARAARGPHPGDRGAAHRLTRFRPRASLGRSGTPRSQEASPVHDLVIDNARLIDGLGTPARDASLAVKDGRIAAISDDRRGGDLGAARERVDAGGLVLAPGIVDLHTHYDAQLTWDPFATPSTSLGVTTVVIGNCGFTIAPCRPANRDLVVRNLTHVEGMSLEAMRAGIQWDFESYPEYLASLERRGLVPNVASFVGHSSVRTYVLGDEASRTEATDTEIAEMRRIVVEALRAGAIGFATSTLEQHNGEHGIPMPSRLADEREMARADRRAGRGGRGVFMLTKGMTSTSPGSRASPRPAAGR